jgi:hypothetical protein
VINVYVAGSSQERLRARNAMDLVSKSPGHSLTHDWLAVMEASKPDCELSVSELEAAAVDDLNGIYQASVFWFLLPGVPSAGAWFELGYFARRWCGPCDWVDDEGNQRRDRLIISGPGSDSVFIAWLRSIGAERYETDEEAANALKLGGSNA